MKLVENSVAGSGVTVLVGFELSIVTRACLAVEMPWLGSSSLDLIGGDRRVAVEDDVGHVGDLRAGRQAGLRGDQVADVALAAARAVLGREEAGQDVGRERGGRIDRLEGDGQLSRGVIERGIDDHVERDAIVGHRDGRLIVLACPAGSQIDGVAPADAGQLESAEIQVGVELVRDRHLLGRRGGRR